MLNNNNGDQNCLVLTKVQGLRAGFVDQCMHSAKYKECRTSRIHGVQNKQGKAHQLGGRNVKGFESVKKRLQEFEKTRRTGFGEIARVLGYLRRMPYKTLS